MGTEYDGDLSNISDSASTKQAWKSKRRPKCSSASKTRVTDLKVIHTECSNHGYDLLSKIIGKGAYATVYLAHVKDEKKREGSSVSKLLDRHKTKLVAIKVIDKGDVPAEFLRTFLPRELENHLNLPRHPHVVHCYEHFSTEDYEFLVLEYCPKGDLLDRINWHIHRKERGLPDVFSKKLFAQLCHAVKHCHDNSIVHRDLKCENVLLDVNDNVKLTDFGFSVRVSYNKTLRTACGSFAYAAPEVTSGSSYSGRKADIWSLGVILFAMVNGRLPFPEQKNNPQAKDNGDQPSRPVLKFQKTVSPDCMILISKMLSEDAEKRPSIIRILKHMWLNPAHVSYSRIPTTDQTQIPNLTGKLVTSNGADTNIFASHLADFKSKWETQQRVPNCGDRKVTPPNPKRLATECKTSDVTSVIPVSPGSPPQDTFTTCEMKRKSAKDKDITNETKDYTHSHRETKNQKLSDNKHVKLDESPLTPTKNEIVSLLQRRNDDQETLKHRNETLKRQAHCKHELRTSVVELKSRKHNVSQEKESMHVEKKQDKTGLKENVDCHSASGDYKQTPNLNVSTNSNDKQRCKSAVAAEKFATLLRPRTAASFNQKEDANRNEQRAASKSCYVSTSVDFPYKNRQTTSQNFQFPNKETKKKISILKNQCSRSNSKNFKFLSSFSPRGGGLYEAPYPVYYSKPANHKQVDKNGRIIKVKPAYSVDTKHFLKTASSSSNESHNNTSLLKYDSRTQRKFSEMTPRRFLEMCTGAYYGDKKKITMRDFMTGDSRNVDYGRFVANFNNSAPFPKLQRPRLCDSFVHLPDPYPQIDELQNCFYDTQTAATFQLPNLSSQTSNWDSLFIAKNN